jgi:hypothetical protein
LIGHRTKNSNAVEAFEKSVLFVRDGIKITKNTIQKQSPMMISSEVDTGVLCKIAKQRFSGIIMPLFYTLLILFYKRDAIPSTV